MALLKPGWEKSYYGRPAIEPVVCVGRILSHEKLPDGKYNFLLQGVQRARIIRENGGGDRGDETPYRTAQLQPLEETPAPEIELEDERRQLHELFMTTPLGRDRRGPAVPADRRSAAADAGGRGPGGVHVPRGRAAEAVAAGGRRRPPPRAAHGRGAATTRRDAPAGDLRAGAGGPAVELREKLSAISCSALSQTESSGCKLSSRLIADR